MSLRTFVLSALLGLGLAPIGIAADPDPDAFAPQAYGIHRYQGIWKRSPFIVETVAEQVSVGLSAKWSLVGIASIANRPAVFLVDKTNSDAGKNRILLIKGTPHANGVELVDVALDRDPRKSSASIRQGGQSAKLTFDPMSLGPQAVAGVQPGLVPPPPIGGMAPPPSLIPAARPAPNSGIPTPPPSPRRIIRPAPINLTN